MCTVDVIITHHKVVNTFYTLAMHLIGMSRSLLAKLLLSCAGIKVDFHLTRGLSILQTGLSRARGNREERETTCAHTLEYMQQDSFHLHSPSLTPV